MFSAWDQSLGWNSQSNACPYQAIGSIHQSLGCNSNKNLFKTYIKQFIKIDFYKANLENKQSGQNQAIAWILIQALSAK